MTHQRIVHLKTQGRLTLKKGCMTSRIHDFEIVYLNIVFRVVQKLTGKIKKKRQQREHSGDNQRQQREHSGDKIRTKKQI